MPWWQLRPSLASSPAAATKILETAIDRCFLQKDADFVGKVGEKAVTHLVNALHAQLLVSQLPSVVAPPSSMEAVSSLRLAGKPANCLLEHAQPPFLG